jgi:hypothetical protein
MHKPGQRAFTTFAEAERFARKRFLAGHGGGPTLIHRVTARHPSGAVDTVEVAQIRDDALGRLWTDAIGAGYHLMPESANA